MLAILIKMHILPDCDELYITLEFLNHFRLFFFSYLKKRTPTENI